MPKLENGVILSQLATSSDIENINKEIVESVKFQFLNKSFIVKFRHRNKIFLLRMNSPKSKHLQRC
jgi:hypothetical protein